MKADTLERPVRLCHRRDRFADSLAELGSVNLQVAGRGLEFGTVADPSGAHLALDGVSWFPALGISFAPSAVAAVHACPVASRPDCAGVVEIDLAGGGRIGFAVPSEDGGRSRFHGLIRRFGIGESDAGVLGEFRRENAGSFEMCPCCEAAGAERRARPGLHPLARILAHCAEEEIELHLSVDSRGFSLRRFLPPGLADFSESIALLSGDRNSVLRIDPMPLHAMWILPRRMDGETRTVAQVFDPLGEPLFSLSTADPGQLRLWQAHCRDYYG